ncbi:hypothetical protein [Tenacibaculum haliotis]|uniref:hypothetical protein n=1 Tax=Tenacibaculum haliotis TaxID=1888914 RepID=UPI0021B02E00|nr:hypothetical protein [Tenacibaculum haliotis]MCT4699537.1 hypothetical protein [Tenacibaculum haliotis]
MNDIVASITMILILGCHTAAILIGYKKQKTTLIISYLNAIIVVGFFIFWIIDNLNVKQHNFGFIELSAIGIEVCILIAALYSISGFYSKTVVKVINYIGFGFHFLFTIGMLYFMLTFKFDTLF